MRLLCYLYTISLINFNFRLSGTAFAVPLMRWLLQFSGAILNAATRVAVKTAAANITARARLLLLYINCNYPDKRVKSETRTLNIVATRRHFNQLN
jgi:hypothetical protein